MADNNFHEEEVLGKAYDARLMKRLLNFIKPSCYFFHDFKIGEIILEW